jgi:aldose 1-epimerase
MSAGAATLLGLDRRLVPLAGTLALFVVIYGFGVVSYDAFLKPQVFLNLFIDNAFLLIVAVGMTFVILTGGIDLSVGSLLALTTMGCAALLKAGWHPGAVIPLMLLGGSLFGAVQGFLVHRYRLQPFIVTLAGMFVARGLCYLIDTESIPVTHAWFQEFAYARVPLGPKIAISAGAILAILTALVAIWIAHATRFGRTVYAIGGSAKSAALMGLRARGPRDDGVHAVGLQPARDGTRARRHRGRRHRWHAAHGRCRLRGRHGGGRAHPRHHPDAGHLQRHAELLVDSHRRRHPAAGVLRGAARDRRPHGEAHMIRDFGRLGDGRSVEAISLGEPEGLQLQVLTYGAILHRLTWPARGQRRDLILYFDTLGAYEQDRSYVGPVVGRFGNRIARGRFMLDGQAHQVTTNEGANHLHGGALGFSKRLWQVREHTAGQRVLLGLHSPAGEEGYPGNLDATIDLQVTRDTLRILLGARSDAATPVNLTYHPYFNLTGNLRGPAIGQRLRIPADHYLPVGPGLIPTGELAPVAGTTFDFRSARPLAPPPTDSDPQLALGGGYDHCWVLSPGADCACELSTDDCTLTMRGSGPGLQFYNGQFLSRSHPDLGNGVILEPQGLPDSPNQPSFPSSILRPGEQYRAEIEYRLWS